jgi:hypothetical protein
VSLESLVKVSSVPVQRSASTETGKKIIEASAASDTDDEETEGGRIQEQAFGVDPFPGTVLVCYIMLRVTDVLTSSV